MKFCCPSEQEKNVVALGAVVVAVGVAVVAAGMLQQQHATQKAIGERQGKWHGDRWLVDRDKCNMIAHLQPTVNQPPPTCHKMFN